MDQSSSVTTRDKRITQAVSLPADDGELFEALCELIGDGWQVQPVDDGVLATRVDGPDGKRLAKDVQNLPRWQPAGDGASR